MKIRFKRGRRAVNPPPAGYTEGQKNYTAGYTAGQKNYTAGYTGPIRQAIRRRLETIRAVYGYRHTDAETVRTWLESFPEIQKFERNRPIKRALMAVCTAAAFISFYTRQPFRVSAVLFCLAAACLIWFDVGRLFSRILAENSRALLAAACLAWTVALKFPTLENLITAAGAAALAALAIKLFNIRWLSAQVYKRSETVKEALKRTPSETIDNLWRGTAAAQVRALFFELGLPTQNVHLEHGLKGVYTIGYSQACRVNAGTIDRAKEALAENKQLKAELAARDDELDRIVEFARDYETHAEELADLTARLAKAEAAAEAGQAARDEAERLLHENCKLEQRFNDLTIDYNILHADFERLQASAEPPAEDLEPDGPEADVIPIDAIDTEAERRELKLAEAVARGYGVTRAQKYAGVTHWQAQQYFIRHPEEVAAGKARAAAEAEAAEAETEAEKEAKEA